MALKLFRSTGYSTLLMAGEQRLGLHPGGLVLAVSLWIGVVCNVALWRVVAGASGASWASALGSGALQAAATGMVLSMLGWRRTVRAAATVLLVLAALVACGLWIQALPVESLWTLPPRRLLPAWPALLRWQVPLLLLLLAVLPSLWVWQVRLRRLSGPQQLRVNLAGMVLAAAVLVAGGVFASPAWQS